MAKVRIFNWAKDKGLKSVDVVNKLNENGHKVRNHTSSVEAEVLESIYGSSKPAKSEKTVLKVEKKAETPAKEKVVKTVKEEVKKSVSTETPKVTTEKVESKTEDKSTNNSEKTHSTQGNNSQEQNGYQGNRPQGQGGYQGNKPQGQGGYQGNRPQGQGGYQGNRPQGQGGYQGNRPQGQGGYQGNRPQGQGGYQGNRPQGQGGYQGNKPQGQGGYQGNRPQGQGGYQGNRPQGQGGYQGNRPQGQGGYQGNRPQGQGGYQGNRPQGQGGYQGNRPQGQGGYQGNRPQGQGGYQGNRPQGQGGYQGNRPQGQGGYQGNRPQGQGGYQGNRPQGQGGYQGNRPAGQGGYQGGNRRFGNPNPKQQESELPPTEAKKSTSTKRKPVANRQKNKRYDRFSQFDSRENNMNNAKTKTQLKKEMRKQRQIELSAEAKKVVWTDDMTVAIFANQIDIPATDIIGKLFELGIMSTINQTMDRETAEIICTDYNIEIVEDDSNEALEIENLLPDVDDATFEKRPPIVTIMGHVDHGKTTLLDTIRNANVTRGEAGGITQHIGAYQIEHEGTKITFLDTPGHAAFSEMRARGANVTDITILVVAADDGVMPQTKEAISHALDAKTPIIVAVNKMDKPDAQPDRVMAELAEYKILSEEWGGDVPFVKISAKNNQGIDELLEYIKVLTDIHSYEAPIDVVGYGTVIEAHLDKGRGPVATILMDGGILNVGDPIVIGSTWGSVRVMQDEYGERHKKITASMPVEITGLKDVPTAGDRFVVMPDAKTAQEIGEKRAQLQAQKDRSRNQAMSLDELNAMIEGGEIKELPIIVKADVQGSVEALANSLEKIDVNGVKARIVHRAVGPINESDVQLATASGAILIGFNVRADAHTRKLIEKEKISTILNSVIYNIIEEIENSMLGMREKKVVEEIIGYAKVENVFKITNVGKVAGAVVSEGKILRSGKLRLIRDGVVCYDGDIGQLKRFKDDAKEVIEGQDCGISFKDYNDIKPGDELECYTTTIEVQE
ncbi:MAG: translation initiation factor IF-2 [Mycoplasmatales bacterium]